MSHRSGEIDTLFQRLAVAAAAPTDPTIAADAAHAVEDWPLLAMLTPARPAPTRPAHHMMMPVEEPIQAAAPVAPAPLFQPEPAFAPEPEPEAPSHQLSPLEQLFRRAEQTGKPQTFQPTVFAAPAVETAPAPPPLKVPTQRRLAPLTPQPTATAARAARPDATTRSPSSRDRSNGPRSKPCRSVSSSA